MNYHLIENNQNCRTILETIFTNRGFKKEDIYHYLNTTDDDLIDPSSIENMRAGAQLLLKHVAIESPMALVVDCDCDGYTSAAAFLNYLNYLFPHYTQTKVSYILHEGKQHGIELDKIPEGTKLVVAPDSSSEQIDEHRALKEQGIDVLVIDHHETELRSDSAVVINNQLCDYPTKSLSGVGMVYKFCAYLDSLLDKKYSELITDLAALGIVADVCDLRDIETRHILTKGFSFVRNPLFECLKDQNAYSMKDEVNPMTVAFYIAPYINAICRSGTMEEKTTVFDSMLEWKALDKVESTKRGEKGRTEMRVLQACRYMTNVKNRQKRARDAGYDAIQELIEENNLLDNKLLIVCIPEELEIEGSLRGLIANQLMSEYQRPVLILSDCDDTWSGSARGLSNCPLDDLKQFCIDSKLIEWAQGL